MDFNNPIQAIKSETTTDVTEIIKSLVDVFSGQAHNRQLLEALKTLISYQNLSQKAVSESMMQGFMSFYQRQLEFYIQTMQPQDKNIFSWFFPEEEADPRTFAWEDTAKFVRYQFLVQGIDPQAAQQQKTLLEQSILNISAAIQANTAGNQEREKLMGILSSLREHSKETPSSQNGVSIVDVALKQFSEKKGT